MNNAFKQVNYLMPLLVLGIIWTISVILIFSFSDKEDRILKPQEKEDEYLMYGDPYLYFQIQEHRMQQEMEAKKK